MKVISIKQPWASLIVLGHKGLETRSWNTKYRGQILIHASKPNVKKENLSSELESYLQGIDMWNYNYPLGVIVGKANLQWTQNSEILKERLSEQQNLLIEHIGHSGKQELAFGDFSDGRYGWCMNDTVAFPNHAKVNGQLGIWNLDERICFGCGCTERNCWACIEKTGHPCYWIGDNICSACRPVDCHR